MGRRIFIIAGLVLAAAILGIMVFVEPKGQEGDSVTNESPLAYATPLVQDAELSFATPVQPLSPAEPVPAEPTPEGPTPADPTPEGPPVLASPPFAVALTPTPAPTAEPTPEPTPTLEPTPTPEPTPTAAPTATPYAPPPISGQPLAGYIIGLDPGHQAKSNSEQEPVSPGSSDMKKKVSSGTAGRFTRTPEHEVNLNVGLHLRDLLKAAGATVIMTRESANVNISNSERAILFNEKKVDLGVRIHCNGNNDTSVAGAFMLVPKTNPYKEECNTAARYVLDSYGAITGIGIKKGITVRSDQTGFNWCERPIVNIEMGHMTNEAEDYKLSNKDFQKVMAQGIYEGIVKYFAQRGSIS